MILRQVIFLILLTVLVPVSARDWQASSMDKPVALVELFVAEGCGLCPPAEKWLQDIAAKQSDLVPVIYHIDYLDDKKGWIDRFAQPEFSQRQRQLAKLNLYNIVFTPEIFISGEVLHNWREHGQEAIEFIQSLPAEAAIAMTVKAVKQQKQLAIKLDVQVQGENNRQHSKLYLLLKQDDIISHIQGGDNAGTTFNHRDLVRTFSGPYDLSVKGASSISTRLAIQPDWDINKLELVAFVQNLNDGYVLQTVTVALKK